MARIGFFDKFRECFECFPCSQPDDGKTVLGRRRERELDYRERHPNHHANRGKVESIKTKYHHGHDGEIKSTKTRYHR